VRSTPTRRRSTTTGGRSASCATGDGAQARETLFKIGLTHHLAFDFERANEAFTRAFSLPSPSPQRLEPTERIEVSLAYLDAFVPGYAYTDPSWELVRHLYRGLVKVGPEFELQPDLAEAFEIGPDGLVYRFRLRPDARWSDGVPVTADDFVFTWQRMTQEGVETAFLLEDVESAEAPYARTLEVRLREPRNYSSI
jgi:ABC-type transport system substrate-binding protein